MEEKKIAQKAHHKEGNKQNSVKRNSSLTLLQQKDCLCIPLLGDLQNTKLKVVLFSQFKETYFLS